MSESTKDGGASDVSDDEATNDGDLSPQDAYDDHTSGNGNLSYREIGEKNNVSKDTARRRVQEYKATRDRTVEEVRENPDNFDLEVESQDNEPDENPYDNHVECPSCGNMTQTPDQAGKAPCTSCNTPLQFSEEEVS